MTQDEFNIAKKELDQIRDREMSIKSTEYTQGSGDVHNNFKRVGAAVGVEAKQCWAVYAGKHWESIMNWTKGGEFESEEAIKRFGDLINYLELGYAMYVDEQKHKGE